MSKCNVTLNTEGKGRTTISVFYYKTFVSLLTYLKLKLLLLISVTFELAKMINVLTLTSGDEPWM